MSFTVETKPELEEGTITLCGTLVPVYYASDSSFELWSDARRVPLKISGELLRLAKKCSWDDMRVICRRNKDGCDVLSMTRREAVEESEYGADADCAFHVGAELDEDAGAWIERYGPLEPAVGA